MKLRLHTETVIDSSHQLVGYDGKCSRIHGHTWFLEIWIEGDNTQLDKDGILFDFGKVKEINEKYDHFFINSIEPFNTINPTAENMVLEIYKDLKKQKDLDFCVRLYETKVGKDTYCQTGDFDV